MPVTFADYKPIRNRIRKYDAYTVLCRSVEKLHELHGKPFPELAAWRPWHLLLIIKWTLLDGDFNPLKKHATLEDLGHLMNMVHGLSERGRMPTDFSSVTIFLKNMAFQQLWLQRHVSVADLGRQIPLFLELRGSKAIGELFRQAYGFLLKDFLELSFGVAAQFLSDRKQVGIPPQYFSLVEPLYPPGTVQRFLELVSLDRLSARLFLKKADKRVQDFDARLYEETPLCKHPLLRIESGSFICYAPQVLFHGLSSFVYDLLRDHSPDVFSEHFGRSFEQYIAIAAHHLGAVVFDETVLKKELGSGKVVDYLLPFSDANVMIEAKAIEMTPHARVSPDATVVTNHLRKSVLKAVQQAMMTANRLRTCSMAQVSSASESFLLVVTFKHLNVGNGRGFLVEEAAAELESFTRDEKLDIGALPRENIYLLNIEEFEWLVEFSREQKRSLPELLRAARTRDQDLNTARFRFEQHLREEATGERLPVPAFASEPFDRLCSSLRTKLTLAHSRGADIASQRTREIS